LSCIESLEEEKDDNEEEEDVLNKADDDLLEVYLLGKQTSAAL
jgi:hypothetical protein